MISFTESQQKLPSTCLASLINPMRDRQHYNIMLIELNHKVLQVLDKTTGHGCFTMIGYDKEGREQDTCYKYVFKIVLLIQHSSLEPQDQGGGGRDRWLNNQNPVVINKIGNRINVNVESRASVLCLLVYLSSGIIFSWGSLFDSIYHGIPF